MNDVKIGEVINHYPKFCWSFFESENMTDFEKVSTLPSLMIYKKYAV